MVFAITATVGEFFLELIYFGVHGVTSQGVTLAVRIVLEVLFHGKYGGPVRLRVVARRICF